MSDTPRTDCGCDDYLRYCDKATCPRNPYHRCAAVERELAVAIELRQAAEQREQEEAQARHQARAYAGAATEALLIAQRVLRRWAELYAEWSNANGQMERLMDRRLPPADHVRALEVIADALDTHPARETVPPAVPAATGGAALAKNPREARQAAPGACTGDQRDEGTPSGGAEKPLGQNAPSQYSGPAPSNCRPSEGTWCAYCRLGRYAECITPPKTAPEISLVCPETEEACLTPGGCSRHYCGRRA